MIWSSPSPNSRKRLCSSGEAQSCLMRTATPALTRLRGQSSHRDSSRKADSNAFGPFILNDLTLTEAANSGTHLKPRASAPEFTLSDQHGKSVRLADLRGKRVVLYFYPKADTPGCTKEACSFRDAPKFPADVVVLGIDRKSTRLN